jgi:SagB-type dehydrogenase family enzyme
MVPPAIHFLERLPLTANGKVDRTALPQQVIPTAETMTASQASPLQARLLQIVAAVLKQERIDPNTHLLELGASSIDMVRIATAIEQEFGFRPQLQELIQFSTAGELVQHYETQLIQDITYSVGQPATASAVDIRLQSYRLILDQTERDTFRRSQPGLRPGNGHAGVALSQPEVSAERLRRYLERRSHRRFLRRPISGQTFGLFLGALQMLEQQGHPKYRYGSGGGLYPVQTYLYLKNDAVTAVPAGAYYYHPAHHQLITLAQEPVLDRTIFTLSNRDIFDQCGFAIFLVAQLDAVGPMYGSLSRDLCLIEAGLISQLLETEAAQYGIGLCQIGACDFARVQHLFQLTDTHHYLHCLLGGSIESINPAALADKAGEDADFEVGTL